MDNLTVELARGKFKSLEAPASMNFPPFCVITGVNGSGKTHLLEMLHAGLARPLPGAGRPATAPELTISTGEFDFADVVLETGDWSLRSGSSSIGNLQGLANGTAEQLKRPVRAARDEEQYFNERRIARVRAMMGLPDAATVRPKDLPHDFVLQGRVQQEHIVQQLCDAFNSFMWKILQDVIDKEITLTQVTADAGVAPWDLLNGFISEAGIKYQCVPPTTDMMTSYDLNFRHESGFETAPSGLSSGERTVVGLAMWLLAAGKYKVFPKVILLDEADAHLHPQLIPGFIRALRDYLVRAHGSRVILTTHRPETVLAAGAGHVLEMHRDAPRLRVAGSLGATLRLLGGNHFLTIIPTRCVVVEDDDDAAFYGLVVRMLDAELLPEDWRVPVFQPAVLSRQEGGGRTKVEKWVERLRESGLGDLLLGLVDRDAAPPSEPGIYCIDRYSIENYLLDPLNVYAGLLDKGKAPPVASIQVERGGERALGAATDAQLQEIADAVLGAVSVPPIYDTGRTAVRYVTGQTVQLPNWLRVERGKDLVKLFQDAYPQSSGMFGVVPLMKPMERVGMVPADLLQLVERLGMGK